MDKKESFDLNGLVAGLATGSILFLVMLAMGYFGEMTFMYLLAVLFICFISGLIGGTLGGMIVKTTLGARIGGIIISLIALIFAFYLVNN